MTDEPDEIEEFEELEETEQCEICGAEPGEYHTEEECFK